jgi:hypothetical protein
MKKLVIAVVVLLALVGVLLLSLPMMLHKAGAVFESQTAFRDFFATHVAVDDEQRFVTGQNQNSGLETAHTMMAILSKRD